MDHPNLDKTKIDHALAIIKAAANAVPFIGGPIGSLMSDYIPTSVDKRKTSLLIKLQEDLKKLEDKFNEENLSTEFFITTFMRAFRSAVETHQEDKINAFRAIILNVLIDQSPDEDEIAIFLNITERLTPLHFKILKILSDPQKILNSSPEAKSKIESISMGGVSTLFDILLPDYPKTSINLVFNDLYSMGLQNTERMGVTMTASGIVAKRTTEFGDKYIAYITLPTEVI